MPAATLACTTIVRSPSMRLRMPTVRSALRSTKFEIGTEPCAVSTRNSSSVDSVRRSSGRRSLMSTASSTPAGLILAELQPVGDELNGGADRQSD